MYWILDFDDTLALGPNTWALETVMPDIIKKYQLPFDRQLFDEVMLKGQEKANLDDNEEAVVNYVFEALGWDLALKDELIHRTYNEYQPQLFEDSQPFLEARKQADDTVIIVSNNNYAAHIIEQLGIAPYFSAILTPKQTAKRRKPYHDMWEDVLAIIGKNPVHMVGDDPWSDGLFGTGYQQATTWILDRLQRYQTLHDTTPYRFVESLGDIKP